MRILDLFSGIGGFSLAGEALGMETVAFCECEKYPTSILKRHWPEALTKEHYLFTLEVCWNGLRTYLHQRWFVALLGKSKLKYPIALQKAIMNYVLKKSG